MGRSFEGVGGVGILFNLSLIISWHGVFMPPHTREKAQILLDERLSHFESAYLSYAQKHLSWDKFADEIVKPFYNRRYTNEELVELNNFYSSPTERKMIMIERNSLEELAGSHTLLLKNRTGDFIKTEFPRSFGDFFERIDALCERKCYDEFTHPCDEEKGDCAAVIVVSKDVAAGEVITDEIVAVRIFNKKFAHSLLCRPIVLRRVKQKNWPPP